MEIKHCPSCGSGEIEKNSYSAEYMSSTRYSCKSCEWEYEKGSGMGVGSSSKGVHPKDAGTSDAQDTLTQIGEWCGRCNTSAKPGYCQCVDSRTEQAFCSDCANYSATDTDNMHKVATYFGRHSPFDGWNCDICDEKNAQLKVVSS
jgi:hypothetical protein